MKYSFIVPVYNCETYLEECVQSILAQTVQDLEIILVDDGSTDGSGQLCDELECRHHQIHTVHQHNMGVSAARNRGIQEACGEYLLFVDSDDRLLPFSYEIWAALEENALDLLIFGMRFQYYRKDNLSRIEDIAIDESCKVNLQMVGEKFSKLFQLNCFSSSCNKIYRRSILVDNGIFFDSRLINYEDLAFSLRYIAKCDDIYLSSEIGYLYRLQEGKDHTVQRIARIDDVIGNTDLIAETFMQVERAIGNEEAKIQIHRTLFGVYMALFLIKMQTTPIKNISRYCKDFNQNIYVRASLPFILGTAQEGNPVLKWIQNSDVYSIWVYIRWRRIRNALVKTIKKMIRWRR